MIGGSGPQREAFTGSAHDIYTAEEAVDLYSNRAGRGLFPQEEIAVDRYFRQSGASVLDVGCGTGRVANSLHERGFDVTGIDISKPLIEEARKQFPDIDFRIADICDSGLPAEGFDYAIFSYFGLDYVLPEERRKRALRELYRVLKPSGILAFSSHNSWNHVPSLLCGNWDHLKDLYLTRKNIPHLFSRTKTERLREGEVDIYVSNPLHQWLQLRTCGFTLLDIVGKQDGLVRFFVRQPYYIVKK